VIARKRFQSTAAACLAAAFLVAPCAAPARPLSPGDLAHIAGISSPQISPDGKTIAVIVSRINFSDNKSERDLDLIDVATHARRTLTYHRSGLGDPAWSPSGDRLAFSADEGAGDDAKSQVFIMPMNGGDARPLTNAPEGVDQFAWRPDGAAIAYAAQDAKAKLKGADRYRDAFEVGNAGITARGAARPVHLWLVQMDGGKARRLTNGAQSVATGEAQSTLSWSHDGKSLAFLLAPNAVLNDANRAHAVSLDVPSGTLTAISGNKAYESDPLYAPTGNSVAYVHSADDNQITLSEAFVTTPGNGPGTAVSHAYDRAVHATAWQPDGSGLFFTCNDGTNAALVRAPLAGAPERVDLDGLNIASPLQGAIAHDGGIAFVGSSSTRPAELYYRAPGAKPVQLTTYNASIAAMNLGTSETVSYTISAGLRSDAVLLKPAGFVEGKRYPLVVLVHGGPTSASVTAFDRLGQLMTSRGWLVLEPNYRGSDNHGLAYQRLVRYDPEEGPGKDIIAALDTVRARGIVDEHRIAVSGWSYGGIMTAWMVTHYHFWRAGVSGASVNDWTTDYSVADDMDSDKALFHGSPFVGNNRAEWNRASAVNYAKDVTTATLILSDNGDNRDPIATSYMFYRALKDNNKDVTFIAYPINGHFPGDPVRTLDVYTRWVDYIARHF
jgi:dipeptidyl aminopeptidase/acylaminoacyl peptidase